jgi:hypothetical protein
VVRCQEGSDEFYKFCYFADIFHNFKDIIHNFINIFHNFVDIFRNFVDIFRSFIDIFRSFVDIFRNFVDILKVGKSRFDIGALLVNYLSWSNAEGVQNPQYICNCISQYWSFQT